VSLRTDIFYTYRKWKSYQATLLRKRIAERDEPRVGSPGKYNGINMILIVHGGAGSVKPKAGVLRKLSDSLSSGYQILLAGGSALEAVVESIKVLEDSGIFNAGCGGNLQLDGVRRLDASVMEGREFRAGSVIGLEGVRNPVVTARHVMDSPHVILTNKGAKKIASANNLSPLPEPDQKAMAKLEILKKKEKAFMKIYSQYFSTVGAVALDGFGDLAAGASTGGIPLMLPGRVGDTPLIGSGVYAENSLGAVACTGTGEHILRLALAKEICMNLKSLSPRRASSLSLRRLLRIGGQAGIIVLNYRGRHAVMHTTPYMASGYADEKGLIVKAGFKKF
jgi:beta-aspartyl-peptidase (threonine type)